MSFRTFFFTAVLLLINSAQIIKAAPVEISVHPDRVFIERSGSGQFLNFDFRIKNLTDKTVRINSIEISVYDEKGKLSFRRAIDSAGFSPAIETIPNREISAGQTVIVFNPLYSFEPFISLNRLRYVFSIAADGTTEEQEVFLSPEEYRTKKNLILPIGKRLQISSGHDFYAHHRRLDYLHPVARKIAFTSNFMRYGYDFFVIDEDGNRLIGDDRDLENYFGFGEPVYAPGKGKIVAVENDFPEDLFSNNLSVEKIAQNPLQFYGNLIIIDHLNGEFSMLAHLKQSSVRVKPGETVQQGQLIAQIGNSGSAETPHLHYELRTGSGFGVEDVPSYFYNFRRIIGSRIVKVKHGMINSGDIVSRQ